MHFNLVQTSPRENLSQKKKRKEDLLTFLERPGLTESEEDRYTGMASSDSGRSGAMILDLPKAATV